MMFKKENVNLRMAQPRPKHFVLLRKIEFLNLTFRVPRIVIYSYNKTNEMY